MQDFLKKRERMATKRLLLFLAVFVVSYAVDANPLYAETGEKAEDEQVIERVIKIEGTVEKPRVLFIVPRSRVWKEEPFKKSFIKDILKPVYPETSAKDIMGQRDIRTDN